MRCNNYLDDNNRAEKRRNTKRQKTKKKNKKKREPEKKTSWCLVLAKLICSFAGYKW